MYDDSRLLGNLDWAQQARRHDAIVFKLLQSGWQVDLGAAFNQNTDAFNYNGTYYSAAKNYKAMQFLYAAKTFGNARFSYLFFCRPVLEICRFFKNAWRKCALYHGIIVNHSLQAICAYRRRLVAGKCVDEHAGAGVH